MLYHLQEKPPAVEDMLSWNTLTPHYEEDVIYALNAKNLAKHLDMDPSTTMVRPQTCRTPQQRIRFENHGLSHGQVWCCAHAGHV